MAVAEDTYLTIKEIAQKYRFSQETIRRYIRQGKLEAISFEQSYRISEAAWNRFLADRQKNKK